ncbi:hypothetical protein SKAU_G00164190 [Synaphobranchus kaupii]|uniref:Uncharacterized protein n=1 Tax=Synaphobranchus kaupii TaxID=118154 RepID=A0A9Q1IXY4_SYNKA|nr:hypothetical protein SKAU_G00164190 [Synaphobranchus kaupii]
MAHCGVSDSDESPSTLTNRRAESRHGWQRAGGVGGGTLKPVPSGPAGSARLSLGWSGTAFCPPPAAPSEKPPCNIVKKAGLQQTAGSQQQIIITGSADGCGRMWKRLGRPVQAGSPPGAPPLCFFYSPVDAEQERGHTSPSHQAPVHGVHSSEFRGSRSGSNFATCHSI